MNATHPQMANLPTRISYYDFHSPALFLIMLLFQVSSAFIQTQRGMLLSIAQYLVILVLIGEIFIII